MQKSSVLYVSSVFLEHTISRYDKNVYTKINSDLLF